ncbi:hypothetical protein [Lacibacter luteus]|uniref:hypothetical protein n=1 Tax=Lacibacter luteus TaxID=2508719 RepID=UPI00100BAF9F|nr:hypothetical protein [Lacibacter luteus]
MKWFIHALLSAVAVGSNGSPNYWKRLDVQLLDGMIHTKCCMVKGVCFGNCLSWRMWEALNCAVDTYSLIRILCVGYDWNQA